MDGMLTGLRHRLDRALRRMEEQHRQLREINDALDGAVASGVPGDIERWLGRFAEALTSHFELEESVVFPALHGMTASLQPQIRELEHDHGSFLERLRGLVEAGSPGGGSTLIDALAGLRQRLRDHEGVEERLVERALGAADSSASLG